MNIPEASAVPWAIKCEEKWPSSLSKVQFFCLQNSLVTWSSSKEPADRKLSAAATCDDDAWDWSVSEKGRFLHGAFSAVKRGRAAKERDVGHAADAVARFDSSNAKWHEEAGAESSLSRITGNIHYLSIIGMGMEAVPLILRDLEKTGAPWFVALEAITGRTGIGMEYPGNFRKKKELWLQWGRDHGYL